MKKNIYIASRFRKDFNAELIERIRLIFYSEVKLLNALPDYPYQVDCDNYIYPIELDKYSVSLHIYSTRNYIQFWQSLKRIVKNNLDLFDGFSFSRQYCKIYLWLNKPYREL